MKKLWGTKGGRLLVIGVALALIAVIVGMVLWPTMRWVGTLALISVAAVLLLWWLIAVGLRYLSRRKEATFDESLAAREGIEDRRREWQSWAGELRKQGIDRYQLPFYLLVGEPQSGKSVLLQNSELHFPFGQTRLSGIGGTRGCDWWFTDEAVVLDLAGRLFTHEGGASDEAEWEAFLDLLGGYRPFCPANGVLLVVPCDSLLQDSPEVAKEKASKIQHALVTLTTKLQVQLPVYLVLTKADKLFGFAECVHRLEADKRHQMFGWSRRAEMFDAPFSIEEVREGFQGVVRRARDLRSAMLSTARIPEAIPEVDRLYAFPEELEGLYPALEIYLQRVFTDSSLTDRVFVRGLYLTSGLQSGAPVAKVCGDLLGEVGEADQRELESLFTKQRAYFIRDVVRKRVFNERGLVRPTARRVQRARRVAWGSYGVAASVAVVTLAMASYFAIAHDENPTQLSDKAYVALREIPATGESIAQLTTALALVYENIDRERATVAEMYGSSESAWRELYMEYTDQRLLPLLRASAERRLRVDAEAAADQGVLDLNTLLELKERAFFLSSESYFDDAAIADAICTTFIDESEREVDLTLCGIEDEDEIGGPLELRDVIDVLAERRKMGELASMQLRGEPGGDFDRAVAAILVGFDRVLHGDAVRGPHADLRYLVALKDYELARASLETLERAGAPVDQVHDRSMALRLARTRLEERRGELKESLRNRVLQPGYALNDLELIEEHRTVIASYAPDLAASLRFETDAYDTRELMVLLEWADRSILPEPQAEAVSAGVSSFNDLKRAARKAVTPLRAPRNALNTGADRLRQKGKVEFVRKLATVGMAEGLTEVATPVNEVEAADAPLEHVTRADFLGPRLAFAAIPSDLDAAAKHSEPTLAARATLSAKVAVASATWVRECSDREALSAKLGATTAFDPSLPSQREVVAHLAALPVSLEPHGPSAAWRDRIASVAREEVDALRAALPDYSAGGLDAAEADLDRPAGEAWTARPAYHPELFNFVESVDATVASEYRAAFEERFVAYWNEVQRSWDANDDTDPKLVGVLWDEVHELSANGGLGQGAFLDDVDLILDAALTGLVNRALATWGLVRLPEDAGTEPDEGDRGPMCLPKALRKTPRLSTVIKKIDDTLGTKAIGDFRKAWQDAGIIEAERFRLEQKGLAEDLPLTAKRVKELVWIQEVGHVNRFLNRSGCEWLTDHARELDGVEGAELADAIHAMLDDAPDDKDRVFEDIGTVFVASYGRALLAAAGREVRDDYLDELEREVLGRPGSKAHDAARVLFAEDLTAYRELELANSRVFEGLEALFERDRDLDDLRARYHKGGKQPIPVWDETDGDERWEVDRFLEGLQAFVLVSNDDIGDEAIDVEFEPINSDGRTLLSDDDERWQYFWYPISDSPKRLAVWESGSSSKMEWFVTDNNGHGGRIVWSKSGVEEHEDDLQFTVESSLWPALLAWWGEGPADKTKWTVSVQPRRASSGSEFERTARFRILFSEERPLPARPDYVLRTQ